MMRRQTETAASFDDLRPFLTPSMRESKFVLALVLISSLVISWTIVATDGNIFAGVVVLLGLTLLLVTVYRIEWSLYILLGLVLLFDQFRVPGYDNDLTFKLRYFANLKEHPYLPHLNIGMANMIELHLFLLILVWLMVYAANRPSRPIRVPVWGALVLFYAAILFSFVYGMKQGGDLLPALWEVRALAYLGFMYWFVPQVIQTREHLKGCVWVIIGVIAFKAFQGAGRFAALGFSFQGRQILTNHEDPVFISTLVILLFGFVLYGVRSPQRTVLLWLLLPLVIGFFAGQRRAAYGAFGIMFIGFLLLLTKKERWDFLRVLLPALVVVALYCAAFWESESKIASPVRLVKSGIFTDRETAGERYYSNLYREHENYNLASTARRAPVLGVGFGNKYDMPLSLVPIPFPLRDYIPHNEIVWLLVKTGAVGYFFFWFFVNCYVFRGAFVFSRLQDPYLKAVCAVAVVAMFNQLAVSYYDLQLTYYRNMVYLGTLMGLIATVERIEAKAVEPKTPREASQ